VAATASHVIATAILLDRLVAAWTPLHFEAKKVLLRHLCWCLSFILWDPLMLTDKAHHRVKTQISEAPTTEGRAIDLQLDGEKLILPKPTPFGDHWQSVEIIQLLRHRSQMPPEVIINILATAQSEAVRHIMPSSTTIGQLDFPPCCPASLASTVSTLSVHKQCPSVLATNTTDRTSLRRKGDLLIKGSKPLAG